MIDISLLVFSSLIVSIYKLTEVFCVDLVVPRPETVIVDGLSENSLSQKRTSSSEELQLMLALDLLYPLSQESPEIKLKNPQTNLTPPFSFLDSNALLSSSVFLFSLAKSQTSFKTQDSERPNRFILKSSLKSVPFWANEDSLTYEPYQLEYMGGLCC